MESNTGMEPVETTGVNESKPQGQGAGKPIARALKLECVDRYIPVTGSIAEDTFTRLEEAVWLSPLALVLDRAVVDSHDCTLEELSTRLHWPEGAWRSVEAAAVHFAFYSAIPTLDINTTGAGFAVVNTQGLAPASAHRVVRLMRRTQRYAYDFLGAAYSHLWSAATAENHRTMGLRSHPLRATIACDLDQWRHLCGDLNTEENPECPVVSLSHAFFTQGAQFLAEEERELYLSLIEAHRYQTLVQCYSLGGHAPAQGADCPFRVEDASRAVYYRAHARLLEWIQQRESASRFRMHAQREVIALRKQMGLQPPENDFSFFLA